jgi:hypothetical protein
MDTAQFLPFAATKGVTFAVRDGKLMAHVMSAAARAWVGKAAEEIAQRKAEIIAFLQAAPAAPPFLSSEDEAAILGWLKRIEESDPAVIGEVLEKCRTDPDTRAYFLMRARKV